MLSFCHRKTLVSNGLQGGTTSLSPCLTPISSGLGMKLSYMHHFLQIKILLSWAGRYRKQMTGRRYIFLKLLMIDIS